MIKVLASSSWDTGFFAAVGEFETVEEAVEYYDNLHEGDETEHGTIPRYDHVRLFEDGELIYIREYGDWRAVK